jgi:hypothetical protein
MWAVAWYFVFVVARSNNNKKNGKEKWIIDHINT